jgi:O-antigen/teichoic acid export membrane protein
MINRFYSLIKDSLYQNAFFIMLNSVLLSGFGFIFWLVAARLYSPEQVGFGSTLMSAMELITSFALLGLNIGIVRFLGKEKDKGVVISSYAFLAASSILFSIVFVAVAPIFVPALRILTADLMSLALFIIFVLCYVLFTITDSVFIAIRKSGNIAAKGLVFSLLKLAFLFILVPFGMYSVFYSVGVSALGALLVSSFFLPLGRLRFHAGFIRKIFNFSFVNYAAQLLETLPGYLMPLFIAATLGTENVAYFYIAFMISSVTFMLPRSMASSLLAEGSNDAAVDFKKTLRHTLMILLPIVALMIAAGKLIFLAYGGSYQENAYPVFVLLALSSISVTPNVLMNSLNNIRKRLKQVIILNALIVIVTLSSSFLLLNLGLVGFGLSFIAGQLSGNLYVFWMVRQDGK